MPVESHEKPPLIVFHIDHLPLTGLPINMPVLLSIKYIAELFAEKSPNSMKVVSLLVKPGSLKYNVKIDYIGFKIPDKFVIGYGLDFAQKYRNLRGIYVLKENGD